MLGTYNDNGAFEASPWDHGPDLEWVPESIDTMEPGPVLAAFLASVDVSKVSGYDRVVVLNYFFFF